MDLKIIKINIIHLLTPCMNSYVEKLSNSLTPNSNDRCPNFNNCRS